MHIYLNNIYIGKYNVTLNVTTYLSVNPSIHPFIHLPADT